MSESQQVTVAPRSLALLVVFLLGGVLLLALGYAAREILIQLLAASSLAMALQPYVRALEGRGMPRATAVGVTFVLAVAGAVAFGFLLLPPLAAELANFTRGIPDLLGDLTRGEGPLGLLESRFHIVEHARTLVAELGGAGAAASQALRAAGGILHTGAFVSAVAFLTFFVALNGGEWFEGFLRVLPEGSAERWRRIGKGISEGVGGYVFGNLLISVIAGVFTTVVLLAMRVPYAVPLGVIMAVLDLVPLVGATLGAVLVGLVALTKGLAVTAIVIAALAIYQQIENNLLLQIVYSRTVRLSPLAIAVSVAAGAQIGGIMGALLGIPVASALKIVTRELLAWRRGEPPPEDTEPPKKPWLRRRLERRSQQGPG